jgi:protein-S-isoprenylcysteine O-methyltransferase Ste14
MASFSALELRVPPPVMALLFGLLMWLVSSLAAAADVVFGSRIGAAIAIALVGMFFGVTAMATFVRSKTTMNPTKPSATSSLVTHGVFRFSRNPMYLSLVLYLIAWAVYLSNWLALVLLPLFVLYINQFQIKPEERALDALYGQAYASYRQRFADGCEAARHVVSAASA